MGLDPTTSYHASGVTALPVVKRQAFGTAEYLTLTFTGVATDVTYHVQSTGDLTSPWETVATFTGSNSVGTITVPDSQPVTASSKRFMRLQVTNP